MKKVLLAVALTALCGLTASTYADVQNIRISGDIRVRGYFADQGDQNSQAAQFIAERVRVSVEADLEDHVLAVVTLQGSGIWGQEYDWNKGSSRIWNVGVSEAYVQLRELFYSPATLTLGRQSLNYGAGLIISSFDNIYSFDAGRLVLDYHPLTIDIVGAQVWNDQGYSASGDNNPQEDLMFINAKYEANSSIVKTVEGYFGWLSETRYWKSSSSPMIIGLRADLTPVENLTASLEGAYEFGDAGTYSSSDNTLSAFIAKANLAYAMKSVAWSPVFNASYTYAQGDSGDGRHAFQPWFGVAKDYNGYVFAPNLSNIQIVNLGASVTPCKNTTLALQGYYYMKANKNGAQDHWYGDWESNLGGVDMPTGYNTSRDLGSEIDAIVGYDYSKDVRCQLVYGVFLPGNAYDSHRAVNEVRGEINVKF